MSDRTYSPPPRPVPPTVTPDGAALAAERRTYVAAEAARCRALVWRALAPTARVAAALARIDGAERAVMAAENLTPDIARSAALVMVDAADQVWRVAHRLTGATMSDPPR